MSLKAEIETWAAALQAYDAQDFDRALTTFDLIADSSKIMFNRGVIQATLGAHEEAVETFRGANEMDPFLAVSYFQCGVSNFLLERYEDAMTEFDKAYLYLRSNMMINYEQLGLNFRLYSCEVLFNRGLTKIYLGREDEGLGDLRGASDEKQTDEHGVIDEAIAERGHDFTVFSIPVGVVYRPNANKLKNVKTKDYLGTAKLVAATDARDAFTGFTGSTRRAMAASSAGPREVPAKNGAVGGTLARAKTTMVTSTMRDIDGPPAGGLRRRLTDATASITPPKGRMTSIVGTPTPLNRSASLANVGARNMMRPASGLGAVAGARGLPTPPDSRAGSVQQNRGSGGYSSIVDDFYDDYANGGPRGQEPDRVAEWAKRSAGPKPNMGRRPSATASSASGGGNIVKRSYTMRGGPRSLSGRSRRTYDDDEEGYGSGEYEDTIRSDYEMVRIRVKLHLRDQVRGMSITPEIPDEEFMSRVRDKFSRQQISLKYKDEDGSMISIVDESDWDSAIDAAREHAKGRPESKLQIWCD